MRNWNPIFNLVINIKRDYEKMFGTDTLHFDTWLDKLHNSKYDEVFKCLQVNQKEEFILIRYGLAEMQEGMWEDTNSIYRECRSVVIDLKREQLVLTPFRKFFNINEVEENKVEAVSNKFKNASTIEIANKLDGSMQNARWYNDQVFMTGSMALDKKDSWRLEEGYSMLTENYVSMLKSNPEFTFIFEYISQKDAHVVLYNKKDEGMHLIGIRNTKTGEQLSYNSVIKIAESYDVQVVRLEDKTLEQLLNEMKRLQSHEKEGWVINLDGHYIKIKCDDYVNIHRLLDKVSSVNVIIEAIANDSYDDLLSKIPDKYKERVKNIAILILKYVRETKELIKILYNTAPKESRKDFMIWIDANAPQDIKHYLRNEYLGKEYNLLKRGKEGYKRMVDLGYDDAYSVLFASVGGYDE
jgi:vacuolar-type H+-ATPase subunit F/Vma7